MKLSCLLLVGCALLPAQVQVLTVNGNNERTNSNTQEFQLSPATVQADSFGKLGSLPVDGQVYAQPLYASGVAVPGFGTRNVVYVATMHNSVYAFEAAFSTEEASPAPMWRVNLGPPVPAPLLYRNGGSDITKEVGILGTGAIDLSRGVIFVVTDSLVSGAPVFRLHALDLGTGEERLNGPVTISANSGGVHFDALQHIQRPGLLLANGAVYVAFGSHGDQGSWHGWIMSYDPDDVSRQIGVYLATPTGNGGAIWQSGRGIAADAQGMLYAITGNGDYDGAQNFSQSFLRLTGAAPVRTGMYTPPDWESMSDNDFDLSAGPVLIPGTRTLLGGDKGGMLYVLNGDTMDQARGPAPDWTGRHQLTPGSIFNLAVWPQPDGALVFLQGSKDALASYRIRGTEVDPTAVSAASATQRYSRIGMTVSANGSNLASGIVWETDGDLADESAPGLLHAYQASDLSKELWNSNMNFERDAMGSLTKFANPTVADGRVFVATNSGRVDVYGLIGGGAVEQSAAQITMVAGAAGYQQDAIAPGELISIFGNGLGDRVLFDGVPGTVTYSSATQINVVAPVELAASSTAITVEAGGVSSAAVNVPVVPAVPGIFAADGSGTGQAIAINEDGSMNSGDHPAAPGSVVVVYATGSVNPVTAQAGDVALEVLYAGGAFPGIQQINLQIPATMAEDPAAVLTIRSGGRSSQANVTIAIGAVK